MKNYTDVTSEYLEKARPGEGKYRNRIVIVECYSSAVNYIHDIRELGFEPVLLEQYQPEEEREKVREMNDAAYAFNGDLRPMVIMAKESYEETLEMVRRLMPVLILPGSDPGTELALRLSFDLKLKNNPPGIFWNIRDKGAMQETLKSAGLRFIRSYTICSEEDALRRYRAEEGRWVVIKPSQAAGSTGVYICGSEREVCEAYRVNSAFVRKRDRKGEKVILQEYISGDEYAVDTISCKGRHVALFGMKYIKRRCNGFGKIYDTDLYFSPDDPSMDELLEYCFQVLTCLGIQYGSVHSEIMIDDSGPVLIEVNPRPAGAFQRYSFQDKVMVNHETAVALDSYLMDPESFFGKYPVRMHLKQPAAVRQICIPEEIFVKRVKLKERLSRLRSFDYVIEHGENCIYPRTTDLDTNGGMIYLTADDPEIIDEDLGVIRRLEKEGLHELYDWYRA